MANKKSSVAEYLSALIAVSEKSQAQIAREAGFANPNIMPMLKSGSTKVPMDKVHPLALSLGIESKELFRRVLKEYQPGLWAAIELAFGAEVMVSKEELALLDVVRRASGNYLPDASDSAVAQLFTEATREAVKITRAKDKASVARYDREPPNKKTNSAKPTAA